MTESQLKTKLMQWFKTIPNCKAVRVEQRPGLGRGVSDILLCVEGNFVALEVKMPGNKTTALQERFLKEVEDAGGYYYVLTASDAKHAISQLDWLINVAWGKDYDARD